LESIFRMNDMDENTILQIGEKIRLRWFASVRRHGSDVSTVLLLRISP
jgi:hypothetical protein